MCSVSMMYTHTHIYIIFFVDPQTAFFIIIHTYVCARMCR